MLTAQNESDDTENVEMKALRWTYSETLAVKNCSLPVLSDSLYVPTTEQAVLFSVLENSRNNPFSNCYARGRDQHPLIKSNAVEGKP